VLLETANDLSATVIQFGAASSKRIRTVAWREVKVTAARATLGNTCVLYFRSFSNMVVTDTASSARSERTDQETTMKVNFNSATELAAMLTAAVIFSAGINTTQSHASPKKKPDERGSDYYYGRNGPNTSYQSGPHTRIYVTKRSWLDAGTEVIPGDRKFTDYAFPPGYSFGQENMNRPLDRQPLNPSSDMSGFSRLLPLY
jgi:hypothetical protein